MDDIFKDLSSLCDPHPIASIRGNQPGKKDGQAKKEALPVFPKARPVSAEPAAWSPRVLIGRFSRVWAGPRRCRGGISKK